MYGIVIHRKGAAVGGFADDKSENDGINSDIEIINVKIHGLNHFVKELVGI